MQKKNCMSPHNHMKTVRINEMEEKMPEQADHTAGIRPFSLHEALRYGEQYLRDCGIEDAASDAWLLLEFVTGIRRAFFLAERRSLMEEKSQERYFGLLKKRGSHIPLQHLTGEQEFMGLPFLVNEHVLIPRQDTEILVEEALKRVQPGMRILDLCTGSGCIAVSIAKLALDIVRQVKTADFAQMNGRHGNTADGGEPEHTDSRRIITVDGSDVSSEALAVAQENIRRLGAPVRLMQSDLFEQVTDSYDMIVSNPPYIRTSVIEELSEEVRLHEPYGALDGKEDGLYFYRRITEESTGYLNPGGWLLFEIGYDQAEDVTGMMQSAGFVDVQVYRDLAGLDRVVAGRRLDL